MADRILELTGEVETTDVLEDLIEDHLISRLRSKTLESKRYYDGYNDILRRQFNEFDISGKKLVDENRANDKLVSNYMGFGVDQKASFIAGKSIVLKSDNEELLKRIFEIVGPQFDSKMIEWIVEASHGVGYLHPYVDKNMNFKYKVLNTEETIIIKDTEYEEEITQFIRYYPMLVVDNKGVEETKTRYRVELWDHEKMAMYQQDQSGKYLMMQPDIFNVAENPRYHWYSWLGFAIDNSIHSVKGHSWNKPPIVELRNNLDMISDLARIKRYIDAIDILGSTYLNNMQDIQLVIWVLKGYDGQDLREFTENLIKYKAMKIREGGSVDSHTVEIPFEASVKLIEWCEQKIYKIGGIVDVDNLTGSSITNVRIKALFYGLENKSNKLMQYMRLALSDFMYFVVEFINQIDGTTYNHEEIFFNFNTTTLINQVEVVDMAQKSLGIISRKTIMEHHPWVDDVEEETKRLEDEIVDVDFGQFEGDGDE